MPMMDEAIDSIWWTGDEREMINTDINVPYEIYCQIFLRGFKVEDSTKKPVAFTERVNYNWLYCKRSITHMIIAGSH